MIDLTTEFGKAVERHLNFEHVIWLTTVDSRLTPQPRHSAAPGFVHLPYERI